MGHMKKPMAVLLCVLSAILGWLGRGHLTADVKLYLAIGAIVVVTILVTAKAPGNGTKRSPGSDSR